MAFELFEHPVVTRMPEHLPGAWSWAEHIPFAFLLMELARPRQIVELGTHSGTSYMAFCQSVTEMRLPTKCFAIDTWQGDAHIGSYEDILPKLRADHDPKYGGFSKLIQSTFDEAAERFAGGSIDLLHIDGLHTYEAARHDYETWRPKLSEAGIILFHDTAVTDRGFGVHQLWGELAAQFPSFEFEHSFGLGVLGVGSNLPANFVEFMESARAEPQKMRDFFAALGGRISHSLQCKIMGFLAHQQQGALNEWKRKVGLAVDPQSEDFAAAMKDTVAFAVTSAREVGEVIEDNLKLRGQLRANNR